MLYKKTKEAISAHAMKEYPRESCGLILSIKGKEKYKECRNIAKSDNDFVIDPEDWADAEDEGDILAIVHSHPDVGAQPSEADLVSCEKTGLTWIILSLNKYEVKDFYLFSPSGYKSPLVGRLFYHGVNDCYTLIKDFYERELNIVLPEFEREDEWWYKNKNLYVENFEKAGFIEVKNGNQPQYGDVLLMPVLSSVLNHAGVYLGSQNLKSEDYKFWGEYRMLHHLYGRVSSIDHYMTHFVKDCSIVVRHKELYHV